MTSVLLYKNRPDFAFAVRLELANEALFTYFFAMNMNSKQTYLNTTYKNV